jgi:FeS assembly SUF system regulator
MLKLAKLTDYATVLMTVMAAEHGRQFSTQELAERSHLGLATTAKLLKQLARGGLVESARGQHGGYRLRRTPAQITVADVVDAVEGPIAVTRCSIHSGGCSIETSCGTRANWQLINLAIRNALEAVTLEQMAASPSARPQGPPEVPVRFAPARAAAPRPTHPE